MSLPVSAPAVAAAACGAVGGDGRGTGVVQGGADGGCKWRSGPEQLASVHQVRVGDISGAGTGLPALVVGQKAAWRRLCCVPVQLYR